MYIDIYLSLKNYMIVLKLSRLNSLNIFIYRKNIYMMLYVNTFSFYLYEYLAQKFCCEKNSIIIHISGQICSHTDQLNLIFTLHLLVIKM